jgi:E3 ubiquitin-protein ligase DOA10
MHLHLYLHLHKPIYTKRNRVIYICTFTHTYPNVPKAFYIYTYVNFYIDLDTSVKSESLSSENEHSNLRKVGCKINLLVSMSARVMIMHYISRSFISF